MRRRNHVETPARSDDVGRCLCRDGPGGAAAPPVLSSRPRRAGRRRSTSSKPTTALTILVALPGVELDSIRVTLSAGTLIVTGERPLPPELQNARILRMEIPYGQFERRIELPPVPFRISGRHLANGCLMLRLEKGSWR